MIRSIALILIFGILSNRLFTFIKLPGLLGMILTGIVLGPYGLNLLDASLLESSSDIRMLALIVILLRAGLGLNKEILNKVGKVAVKMSAIPCLVEGFTIMFAANKILGLPLTEAGMLGFIIAAVSPAVVVPSMLYLKEKMLGMKKGIPVIILAGASADDVFAITLFTTFLGVAMKSQGSLMLQIGMIPVQIIGGIALGLISGYILYKLYSQKKLDIAHMEKLALLLIAAFVVEIAGEKINVAGLLGVMTIGFILLQKVNRVADALEKELNKIWFFAQIFLFVLIEPQ